MRTRLSVLPAVAILSGLMVGCSGGGGGSSPTAPTAPTASTRVISVSGNLAFGDVLVGDSRNSTLTITNTGNAPMSVTGLNVSGGLGPHLTASWTSGQVPAGGSQNVTITFAPTAPGDFSGTVTVVADNTSGTNTISISGTAWASFAGTWSGNYIVERCDGTGSIQDIFCSAARGVFPVGSSLPISMEFTQSRGNVTGTFALGSVRGLATGVVSSSGLLTLQGTGTSGQITATITFWSTRVQGSVMDGNVTYNLTFSGIPGVAVVVTRLGRVTRQ